MNQYERHKPKKTFYNGRWYKSNMEAKVAESLDRHNAPWEYEPCCFLDSRFKYGQYTPDFRIFNSSGEAFCYIEVCGEYDNYHRQRCHTLAAIIEEGRLPGVVVVVSNTLFGAVVSKGGTISTHEIKDPRLSFLSEVMHA